MLLTGISLCYAGYSCQQEMLRRCTRVVIGRSVVLSRQVSSAAELSALVEVAKARRTTAATAMNDASSRAHGVAVITVGQRGLQVEGGGGGESGVVAAGPAEGRLYVIDLAGSERAADSKKHDKARMDETKQINLSLMALKECIRARTVRPAAATAAAAADFAAAAAAASPNSPRAPGPIGLPTMRYVETT
jgi:hypothetical protein